MVHLFREKESTQKPVKPPEATQLLPETAWAQEPMPSGTPPENAVVVTISCQFGSGGYDIARLVATEGDLNYVDNAIILDVAHHLGVDIQQATHEDEQTSGVVRRILEAIHASNPFTISYKSFFDPSTVLAHWNELAYLRLTQRVILEMATQGNVVITGRGSQFLLHNAPRTLHISIFAPLPYRIANIQQEFHLNKTTATRLIEQRDYEQDSYLRRYYGNNGHQPGIYHLLINTSLFSPTLAVNMICESLPLVKEIA